MSVCMKLKILCIYDDDDDFSEEAGQKGVVFIMDMRECSLDMRYINSFLSVLKVSPFN